MKKVFLFSTLAMFAAAIFAFAPAEKLMSSKTNIKFFSTTPAEDISANNYKSVSTLDKESGAIVFSVPMQSFEFEKSLMQKHFNSEDFLNTKEFPKAKMKGTITNLGDVDFSKDGTYTANVKGELTIKGKTNPVNEKATITVKAGKVELNTKFNITLADFDVEFTKGKPSKNIAKTVDVTAIAEY